MSDGFATQPEELDAAARRFDEAADVVARALDDLRATLGGLGDYLGSDEQGRAFAAQYDPKAAEGLAAIGSEAEALHSLGGALRDTARGYAATDGGVASLFPPTSGQ